MCKWLKANKIALNASKTEVIIFRDPRKKSDFELKIKIDGKKLTMSRYVKYLGLYLDCHLSWLEQEIHTISRLSRAKGMIFKIRHYVNFESLLMIYHGIFSSILQYGSLIWGHYKRIVNKLEVIQNKAIRAIHFKPSRYPADSLYKNSAILKISDQVTLLNVLYACDNINGNLPTGLLNYATFSFNIIERRRNMNQLQEKQTNTRLNGSQSIHSQAIESWNMINIDLHEKKHFFSTQLVVF